MKRKHFPELKRLQGSVSYVPDATLKNRADVPNRTRYFDKLHPHMFIEDVRLNIMPIGGRTSKKQFRISVEPPDSEVAQNIETALSPGEYHRNLTEAVCNFVAQCAVELLLFDTSTYEIVYLSEPKDAKLVGFEFVHVNPITLIKRGNVLLQVLPDELATKLNKNQFIELKGEHILTFQLPVNVQGKMDQVMESLAVLSLPMPSEFFMEELLSSGSKKTPYAVKTHRHAHNIALASATKLFGWNARLLFQEEALGYYLIHRSLLFERFKTELRETILKTLNQGIKRASSQLGFTAEVLVTGLPTANDVQAACDHLQKGDTPFAEILEPFRGF